MIKAAKELLKDLETDVAAINAALAANLQTHVPLIAEVGRHILLSGGKRVRPLLFILAARMCGHQGDHLADFSTIFEYLHAATLLHDDVIDAAQVRRGATTANNIWGNHAVILVGDFLLSKALSLAVTTERLKILQVLANATTEMAEGEILQLIHAGNLKLTEAEYFEVITRKTAILMSAACQIGGILAGAPPAQEEALSQMGLNLGLTFQLVDDILDYTGDQKQLGKEVGADLREGRITLPLIHALAQASPPDQARLQEMARDLTPEMAPEFQELLGKYRALEHARFLARQYTLKAQENLELFGPCPEKTYFQVITAELLARTH
ncbi:MAG: polyprenyl synthetase family protein [Deltaproteobacteria bacterium]|nr:polyprenyl synthetase family protein [Deltaproteobacteria bacterium]